MPSERISPSGHDDTVIVTLLVRYLLGRIDTKVVLTAIRELYPNGQKVIPPIGIKLRGAFRQAELDQSDKIVRETAKDLLRERNVLWYKDI